MEYKNILFDETPLVVSAGLAKVLGLNEAIILQQIHYWQRKNTNIVDGRSWVYNSVAEWRKQFPFWSNDTIRRTLNKLIADFILLKGNHNKASMDRSIWYSIDYAALEEKVKQSRGLSDAKCIYAKCTNGSRQNAKMELGKMHKAIPETTHKTTSNILSSLEQTSTPSASSVIVSYLNEKAGSRFKATTAATAKHINARLSEGYTVEDFKTVIDSRIAAWQDDKDMREYIRPSTLFTPTNFENYLNAAQAAHGKRNFVADKHIQELEQKFRENELLMQDAEYKKLDRNKRQLTLQQLNGAVSQAEYDEVVKALEQRKKEVLGL